MPLEISTYAPGNCLPPFLPLMCYKCSVAFASSVGAVGSRSQIGMLQKMKDAFEAW